tara:strand:- start:449 stop:697 length:249 start_codon:yes stop_codon:yes gene_type:complete
MAQFKMVKDIANGGTYMRTTQNFLLTLSERDLLLICTGLESLDLENLNSDNERNILLERFETLKDQFDSSDTDIFVRARNIG